MKEQPVLETRRLVLRPLMAKDDLSVRELANDPQIAATSLWYMHGAGRAGGREDGARLGGLKFSP
jgi:hypothetical protein